MLFLKHTAQKYFEEALNISIKVLGTEDHDDVAASLQSLGYVFFLKGDYANAQKYFERALKIYSAIKDDTAPSNFFYSHSNSYTQTHTHYYSPHH
jgi:tetratricopeptide (TPR) repeat protein